MSEEECAAGDVPGAAADGLSSCMIIMMQQAPAGVTLRCRGRGVQIKIVASCMRLGLCWSTGL